MAVDALLRFDEAVKGALRPEGWRGPLLRQGRQAAGRLAALRERFELAKAAREAGIDARITACSNEWGEGFKRGQVAAQMMGAWLGGHLAGAGRRAPDTQGQWRSAQLPGGAWAWWSGSFYASSTTPLHRQSPTRQVRWVAPGSGLAGVVLRGVNPAAAA
jgi:hypothetical protein